MLRRLKAIQKRHNFNPKAGASQLSGRAELMQPYGRFRELIEMASKLRLPIRVPYNPLAKGAGEVSVRVETKLYVARKFDGGVATDVYKVGYSKDPYERVGASLQTGNDGNLVVCKLLPGDRLLESKLKFKLRKYKTRDLNNDKKGEWYRLGNDLLMSIVDELTPTPPG